MTRKDEPTLEDRLEGRAPNMDGRTTTVDGRKKNPKRFADWGDLDAAHVVTKPPTVQDA